MVHDYLNSFPVVRHHSINARRRRTGRGIFNTAQPFIMNLFVVWPVIFLLLCLQHILPARSSFSTFRDIVKGDMECVRKWSTLNRLTKFCNPRRFSATSPGGREDMHPGRGVRPP